VSLGVCEGRLAYGVHAGLVKSVVGGIEDTHIFNLAIRTEDERHINMRSSITLPVHNRRRHGMNDTHRLCVAVHCCDVVRSIFPQITELILDVFFGCGYATEWHYDQQEYRSGNDQLVQAAKCTRESCWLTFHGSGSRILLIE
jgi:hypothetical protein